MLNIKNGAVGAGAASRYGSGFATLIVKVKILPVKEFIVDRREVESIGPVPG
jgi:hypothetical protein